MPSNQHSTWVLMTNSNTGRIYLYNKENNQLALLKEIQHPENKLRDIELTSDRPGHFNSNGGAHGAFTQASDPKEIKIDDFSRELAKELDHGRNTNAYNKLIVIAPPRMNGLLFQHTNKHVNELVTHKIEKDLIHFSEKELLDFLNQHTQYPEK